MPNPEPTTPQPITLTPIGHVAREEAEPTGADAIPRLRAKRVRLVLNPEVREALLGVEPGSDLMVITYLHRASHDVLQVHPRGNPDRPLRGVFATRSPSRPNPIGVTTVRVEAVDDTVLTVVGLDALDGTPILDVKSYSAGFDTPYEGDS
jgi:tRNA-Thr(GGU) m(6)t(6)A37 methyltransferase TsaA